MVPKVANAEVKDSSVHVHDIVAAERAGIIE